METLHRIAVLGGGSVATSYLFHYVEAWEKQSHRKAVEIVVYEPRPQIGRGSAYETDHESNLLNVTAGAMSVAGDDRQHFFRWLHANGIQQFRGAPITADSFLPRPLFGRYLEDVYRDLCVRARRMGVHISHRAAAALDIAELHGGDVSVLAEDGSRQEFDRVVLAIGNLDSTAFEQLRGAPLYFHNPYPVTSLCSAIPSNATVGIIGTSLSAIDAIAALAANGHRGKILSVSRNGRLPCVRGIKNSPTPLRASFKEWLSERIASNSKVPLHALADKVGHELASYGVDVQALLSFGETPPDPGAFLEEELRASSSTPRTWQSCGNALNDVIDQLWHLLSAADRQTFDRTIRPVWMARRVTFPMENAQTLHDLMRTGQLRVRGGFQSVEHDGRGFNVRCTGPEGERIPCDAIVNATSFSCDAARSSMPLLQAILHRGLATIDPHGGLMLDFATGSVKRTDGRAWQNLSALGSMAAGTYFWTNSMDVNARLAMDQARRHVRSLASDNRLGVN